MDVAVWERLRAGEFTKRILQFEVDQAAFDQLRDDLIAIAAHWREKDVIEKELAWLIFDIPKIAINAAREAERVRPAISDQIWDLALELDTLVLDCFYDRRW